MALAIGHAPFHLQLTEEPGRKNLGQVGRKKKKKHYTKGSLNSFAPWTASNIEELQI